MLRRLIHILLTPAEAWAEAWAWIGEVLDDGTDAGLVLSILGRTVWVLATALFVWLWLDVLGVV